MSQFLCGGAAVAAKTAMPAVAVAVAAALPLLLWCAVCVVLQHAVLRSMSCGVARIRSLCLCVLCGRMRARARICLLVLARPACPVASGGDGLLGKIGFRVPGSRSSQVRLKNERI